MRKLLEIGFAAVAILTVAACGSDDSISTRKAVSQLQPDAGPDQTVLVGAQVTLDGSASSGRGALRYNWESVSSRIALANAATAVVTFTVNEAGVFPFLLWVSSDDLADTWVSSHVVVTVQESTGGPADLGQMVRIPAGFTVVGVHESQVPDVRFSSEAPGMVIFLSAFEIDRYEVSNGEYTAFLAENPRAYDFGSLEGFDGDLQPAIGMSWEDARDYCAWRGRRLASELEWEYAARGYDGGGAEAALASIVRTYRRAFNAASGRSDLRDSGAGDVFEEAVLALLDETVIEAAGSATYPWGGSRPDAAQLNFGGVIAGNVRHTVNVGSYPLGRSRLGAHDMAGNVWEWTADWYDERSYVNSSRDIGRNISSAIRSVELGKQSNSFPTISLADIVPVDPGGANNGEARVIRGGSWIDGELGVRSSSRGAVSPTTRATGIGFRCAR